MLTQEECDHLRNYLKKIESTLNLNLLVLTEDEREHLDQMLYKVELELSGWERRN